MLSHIALRALGAALCLLPLTSAHMQMLDPSPFRDPHSQRNEPKDYNILTPLHADGSDFACKGYQWNTPWTSVATYEAGKSYNMTLKGSATHGGGSCQLSLSCDGGIKFKVIKSIVGGCPLQNRYPFTIPEEFAKTSKATCLFAWTWFNKIGNREMYMNCAVVDIVPKKSRGRPSDSRNPQTLNGRAIARANAAAQTALAAYPDLFVANLKKVNGCVVKETMDVVFDDPGRSVSFGDGIKDTSKPSFKRGVCTGSGMESAGGSTTSSSSSTSSDGGWKESSNSNGKDWTWQGGDQSSQSSGQSQGDDGQWHGGGKSSTGDDGQWHGGSKSSGGDDGQWHGGQTNSKSQQQQNPSTLRPVDVSQAGQQPNANVQSQLDAYLAQLYGKSASKGKRYSKANFQDDATNGQQETLAHETLTREEQADSKGLQADSNLEDDSLHRSIFSRFSRSSRHKRWLSYKQSKAARSTKDIIANLNTNQPAATAPAPAPAPAPAATPAPSDRDSSYEAIVAKLNSLGDTLFTLFKFAKTHLDGPPPGKYIFGADNNKENTNANQSSKKRDTTAQSAAAEEITWSSIFDDLKRIQNKVAQLLQFVENKVRGSDDTQERVERSSEPRVWKRQLVIPGIIPATMPNGEPFSFDDKQGGVHAKSKTAAGSKSNHALPVKTGVPSNLQGEGTPEPGAVEALFPGINPDTLNELPQESQAAQVSDWARTHPNMAKSASIKVSSVASPTPIAKLPTTTKTHGSDGGRVPPVVGPTPFSDWDKMDEANTKNAPGHEPPSVQSDHVSQWVGEGIYHKPTLPTKLPLPLFNVTNTTITTSNATKTTQALGEALKLAFPKLTHPTPNESTPKPPLPSEASSTDNWHDGVFPGLELEREHKVSSATRTAVSTAPNKDEAAVKDAIAAFLPYLLAPGPVLPSNFPQSDVHPTHSNSAPDNLETMPQIVNDLGPEDEARIRDFFNDLAKQAVQTASTSTAAAAAAA